MSRAIKKGPSRGEGFSIVEAVVAVMVLAVVAAMALPYLSRGDTSQEGGTGPTTPDWMEAAPSTVAARSPVSDWMGVDPSAGDRDAQVELRDVLLAEKAFWLEHGDYTASATDIAAFNPGVRIGTSPASGVVISLSPVSDGTVCLTRSSDTGATFSVWEDERAGTFFGAADLSSGPCPAAVPAGYSPGGW